MRVGPLGRQILKADQNRRNEAAGANGNTILRLSKRGIEESSNKRRVEEADGSTAPKRPRLYKFLLS